MPKSSFELTHDQRHLSNLLMQTPAPIALLRGKRCIYEMFNPSYGKLIGDRDVLGKPMREAWPEVEGQNWFEAIERVYETGIPMTSSEKPTVADWENDGTMTEKFFNFAYSPYRDADGSIIGVMVLGYDVTDQVNARKQIADSEEKYRGLFESMDQGFCVVEMLYDRAHKPIDYRYLEVNSLFEEQNGLCQVEGKTIRELVPNLEPEWLEAYGKVALTGRPVRFTEFSEAMGRWFEVYAYRIGYQDERKVAVLSTDVTDKKRDEERLRQSEERLRLATHASVMVGTWDWDLQSDTIYSDDRFARLFSVDPEKGKDGAPVEEYMSGIHPDDESRIRRAIDQAIETGSQYVEECRLLQKDGSIRWVIAEGQCHYGKKGKPLRFPGVVIDITERKMMEQALQESEARFRVVTDNATTGLFIMDDKQQCAFMNPAAEMITGYTFKEVLAMDKPLHDIVHHTHPDGRPYPMEECPIDRALPQRSRIPGEDVFVRPDGTFYPVAFMASPIVKNEIPVGTVVEVRDVTDELNAREEQQRLAAMTQQRNELIKLNKAKDEFIALASHQLRTPATAVKQYISLVMDGYAGPVEKDQLHFLKTAFESNERQLHIINDLLKTAQIDSTKYELNKKKQDVGRLLEDTITDLLPAIELKRQRVSFMGDKADLSVMVDPTELKLVFINLLENASKYSREGSSIKISVQKKNRQVVVAVSDQGVGIDAEDLDRIFEKFTRVSNELSDTVTGTGLGLYWVKQIVELHKGSIKVESSLGKGSTFTVRLPLASIDEGR